MRTELIQKTIHQISNLMTEVGLTSEEGINLAAELLPAILLISMSSEQACHGVLNRALENSHLYINANWTCAQEFRDKRAKERAE